MNKKRKILTVVALAVFGAIIFFHYNSFDYNAAYEETEYFVDKTAKPPTWEDTVPVADAKQSAKAFLESSPTPKFDPSTAKPVGDIFDKLAATAASPSGGRWLDEPTPKKKMTADEFRKKNLFTANKGGEFVIVEYPSRGPYLSTHPGIADVRMPLFVLAVFYAGLFFILGPTATKDRPA